MTTGRTTSLRASWWCTVVIVASGCSGCGSRPGSPDAGTARLDAGSRREIPLTNEQLSASARAATLSGNVPAGYPLTPDAPDWTWPWFHLDTVNGQHSLVVVGWSKQIVDPGLANMVAQARARTNVTVVLHKQEIKSEGVNLSGTVGLNFDKTFHSTNGSVFVEAVVPLP